MKTIITALVALALAGCATGSPISGSTIPSLPKLGGVLSIEDGLKEAKFNLDGAIIVGALPAEDPAAACVNSVLKDLGLDDPAAPTPSFVPKDDTILGRGAVLYIRAQQAQRLAGSGVSLPASCQQLIGKFIIDVGRANASALPGGGLLPKLR